MEQERCDSIFFCLEHVNKCHKYIYYNVLECPAASLCFTVELEDCKGTTQNTYNFIHIVFYFERLSFWGMQFIAVSVSIGYF